MPDEIWGWKLRITNKYKQTREHTRWGEREREIHKLVTQNCLLFWKSAWKHPQTSRVECWTDQASGAGRIHMGWRAGSWFIRAYIMGMRNRERMRKRKSQRYREVTDGSSARTRMESSIRQGRRWRVGG